jgi:hypothetical protein
MVDLRAVFVRCVPISGKRVPNSDGCSLDSGLLNAIDVRRRSSAGSRVRERTNHTLYGSPTVFRPHRGSCRCFRALPIVSELGLSVCLIKGLQFLGIAFKTHRKWIEVLWFFVVKLVRLLSFSALRAFGILSNCGRRRLLTLRLEERFSWQAIYGFLLAQ